MTALPWVALLVASIVFRLPALINAAGTNSDAAVVGLQAMHILRGEWSWFLWGSGYQTSVDSLVAALVFAVTGPSPLALMASTLAGHILLTWFAFAMLRRHLPVWTAALLCTLLVFTPGPVHTYVLYPPRQASLTLAFAGLWLLEGAAASRRPRLRAALGAAIGSFAIFADPYALLFLPAFGLLAVLVSVDGTPGRRESARRVAAALAGGLAGLLPYRLLMRSPLASHGQTSVRPDLIPHNFKLLWDDCLGWLFSYKVYAAKQMSDYAPWEVGDAYHAFQILAAAALAAGILSGGVLFFVKRIPWEVRRLGLVGAVMLPVTLGGFVVSPMVMDHFSSRYLASILLVAPFALAPAAWLLGRLTFGAALLPYLVSAAVGGWASYLPFGLSVDPSLVADAKLGQTLRDRGLHYAVADYWSSYRLTLLTREDPIFVPTNEGEDRHAPYRAAFMAEKVVAYVYDPFRSRERLEEVERQIQTDATVYEPRYERLVVGRFTVLIVHRKPADLRSAASRLP